MIGKRIILTLCMMAVLVIASGYIIGASLSRADLKSGDKEYVSSSPTPQPEEDRQQNSQTTETETMTEESFTMPDEAFDSFIEPPEDIEIMVQ